MLDVDLAGLDTVMTDNALDFSVDKAVSAAANDLLVCGLPRWRDFLPTWQRLSDDQFMAAMRLALAEDATKVAAAWAQVVTRLQSSRLQNQLLEEVAAQIKTVDDRALFLLGWTPLDMLLTILKELDPLSPIPVLDEEWWSQKVPAVEFFVMVLYQLDAAGRDRLWEDISPKFEAVHGVLKYRTVRACIRGKRARDLDPGGCVAKWLELKTQPWLVEAGYRRGYIEVGMHRGASQPYIQTDGCRFVLDRRARYRVFHQADEVLYAPDGRELANSRNNRVVAAYFIPVE